MGDTPREMVSPAVAGAGPLVSVLIAAWQAEETLARAVESVLAQTAPVEIIVIDDASSDATARIAETLAAADARVRLLRQARNQGPSAARNRGIDIARGRWVTVLDADDFFCAPDRLARLVAIAVSEAADFVADDIWKVAEAAPYGPRTAMIADGSIGVRRLGATEFVAGNLSALQGGRREYGFLKPLMSRAFLLEHGLTYDQEIRLGEDYVLYARALIAGAVFVVTDAAGYAAVVRPASLSGSHPTAAHARLIEADRALLSLPGVDAATRRALKAHIIEQRKKLAWRRLIDAKRAADPAAAAACFWAPPGVVADLVRRLWNEAAARVGRRQDAR